MHCGLEDAHRATAREVRGSNPAVSTLFFSAGHLRKCSDLEKIVLNQKRTLDSTRFEHKDLKWSKDCNINVCYCNRLNTQKSASSRCKKTKKTFKILQCDKR